MIVLDRPYVSPFLEKTIKRTKMPVLILSNPNDLNLSDTINALDSEKFKEQYKKGMNVPLYTNSENSLRWIVNNIPNRELETLIHTFKNKYQLRELLKPYYPKYKFQKITFSDLDDYDCSSFPKPFVIKPNVGFFSLAVYFVRSDKEWVEVVRNIKQDLKLHQNVFPTEVLNTSEFIIEQAIEGEEYAVDAYFNHKGKPVIINIYHHYHIDASDTGDRLYYTSKSVVQQNYKEIYQVLSNIQSVTHAKLFPVHLELRLDDFGKFGVIEVNPLRFAGFCVGDLAWFAYKINPYEYFHNQTEPDWEEILSHKNEDRYAFVLGDFPKGIKLHEVKSIDYHKFKQKFSHPLRIRKINYREYPLFSIAFVKFLGGSFAEMDDIMRDDFRDVIYLNN